MMNIGTTQNEALMVDGGGGKKGEAGSEMMMRSGGKHEANSDFAHAEQRRLIQVMSHGGLIGQDDVAMDGGEVPSTFVWSQGKNGTALSQQDTDVGVPRKCIDFMTKCGVTSAVVNNWREAKSGFQLCCIAGGHPRDMCKHVASESFGAARRGRSRFAPDKAFCDEVDKLKGAHTDWEAERNLRSSLLQPELINERSQLVVTHMIELEAAAPALIHTLARRAATAAATGTALMVVGSASLLQQGSLGGVAISSVLTGIAVHLQQCGYSKKDCYLCGHYCHGLCAHCPHCH